MTDHIQLSRRAKRLEVTIPRRERSGLVQLVEDSEWLKVYCEGEWKVRRHSAINRRTWRKAHLAVDGNVKDVNGVEVTTVEWKDGEVFESLVEQVEGAIKQIDGDGAYDTRNAYDVAASREALLVVVPPRENAIPWEDCHPRIDALDQIAEQGRAERKEARAITAAVSRRTPCTTSRICSVTAWLLDCSKHR